MVTMLSPCSARPDALDVRAALLCSWLLCGLTCGLRLLWSPVLDL